jgi:signal transduction histidine kinase
MIGFFKNLFGSSYASLNHQLIDSYPIGMLIYDVADEKVVFVNDRLKALTTSSFSSLNQLVYPDDSFLLSDAIHEIVKLRDGNSHTFRCRLGNAGTYYKISGSVYARKKDGHVKQILLAAEDLTEVINCERSLNTIQSLFKEAERLLQFGTWTWDLKQKRIDTTRGVSKILDFGDDEISFVTPEFFMTFVGIQDQDNLRIACSKAIAERSQFEIEFSITTRSGHQKYLFTKGQVNTNEEGHPINLIGITRDITSMKILERERERSIRELNRTNNDLEEFAYVASHDLQEPLRKIATFTERIKTKYNTLLQEEGNQYISRIIASTESMRSLIDNLLEYSRTSRSTLVYKTANLNDIVAEALADLELKIEETKAFIRVAPLPEIDVIPAEIKQLFVNLLNNALKFRKSHIQPIITIWVESVSQEDKDKYPLIKNMMYHKIIIADNGIGFETQYAEKIFQFFQRLHGKSEYPGAGVGLAICKKIVENHDGFIYAESNGDGAEFKIILPQKQP